MLLNAGFTQEKFIKQALEVPGNKNQEILRAESAKNHQIQGLRNFQKVLLKLAIGVGPKPLKATLTARTA